MDVDLQLRRSVAQGSQRRDNANLPFLKAQSRPGVDVTEWELNHVGRKFWKQCAELFDDGDLCVTINFPKHVQATLDKIKARVDAGKLVGQNEIGLRMGKVVNQYKMA